jgi:hypothetical protein
VRPLRSAAIPVLLLAAAGCRHALPPVPLPPDWQALVKEPRPFAALYRFSCCGHSDLILTLRGDGRALSLAVAAPPGGTVLAAWVSADGGWLDHVNERCREPLPGGVLPLSTKASLPLDPELAALLLSGALPSGARELSGQLGWVEATSGAFWWRARVEGPQPHWTRVVIGRMGEGAPLVTAVRSDRTALPHALTLTAGSVKAELALQVWREAETPAPPGWLSAPVCGGGP